MADPFYDNITLLLHCNGSNGGTTFTDNSPLAHTVTPTSCTTSTAQIKYGSASAIFDGATSVLSIPYHNGFNLENTDWTIEFWMYTTTPNATQYLISHRSDGTFPFWVVAVQSDGTITFLHTDGSGATLVNVTTSGFSISASTWTHVAVVRSAGAVKIYLGGVDRTTSVLNPTGAYPTTSTHSLRLGSVYTGSFDFFGHLDDIRITKGTARYTTGFTPPTAEFSNNAEVSKTISESLLTTTSPGSNCEFSNLASELLILLDIAENQYKEDSISELYILAANSIGNTSVVFSISEVFNIISSELTSVITSISESINDTLNFSTNSFTDIITRVFESLLATDNSVGNTSSNISVLETLVLLDGVLLQFNALISEGLITSDTSSLIIKRIEEILEALVIKDTVTAKVILSNTILDTISLLTSILHGYQFTISESLSIVATITDLWKFHSTISDSLLLSLASSENTLGLLSISDNLNFSSTVSSSAILKELLSSNLIIKIPSLSGSEEYLAYTFSPETSSVTNYDNYNFTSSTKFNGKYLLANSNGLYEYGGTTDVGTTIKSYIETAALSFGTSNLKQVPSLYLGVSSDDSVILIVRLDGKGEITYKLNKFTQDLQTQKVDIGKGLIGRYFQFELITESDIFNLDSIELYPIELKRKL